MDSPDKVTVRCALSAGVVIYLQEQVDLGIEGRRWRPRTDVSPVELRFGDTPVDAGFFGEWLAQNSETDLVKQGWIKRWPPQE